MSDVAHLHDSENANAGRATADIPAGQMCPTCARRIPYPKKDSSPTSRPFSYRVPTNEVEAHREVLIAAAGHLGTAGRPFWVFQTLTLALALTLQSAELAGYAHRAAA